MATRPPKTAAPADDQALQDELNQRADQLGLKYSSDPTLLIKEPAALDGEIIRLALHELEPANALMQKNQLTYRWQWVPSVAQLNGVAQLTTRA